MQLDAFGYDDISPRAAMEKAATSATLHADKVTPGWGDQAYGLLLAFAATAPCRFSAEQVRAFAEEAGLPVPPDPRAWGGVFLKAAKRRALLRVGFGESENRQAHCRPVAMWLKVTA